MAKQWEMIRLPSAKEAAERPVEMLDLFEIDDDVYQMPKNPSAGVALEYLDIATDQGPEKATKWLMEEAIGEEGYRALREHPELPVDDLERIIDAVKDHYLGSKNAGPTRRSRGGRKKKRSG
ncbi:hypothetical protein ACFVWN_01080 [Nocardiopsis flavescens]|uniref:hypothetical protein n=1 Tax=Nocardiopsis flavescens TaxID=758803 RepID=UPI00364E85D9